ncbi:unnamed protein product [Caenorhabditis angaria]|uniref:C-type lectin domain-containing protein n=1 Tax=Caenorhabditis angaria TaxID=860376 RepID=A0A9P1ISM8_9PELO|nr:unnamed protein product [Caenorhabditis angaria]
MTHFVREKIFDAFFPVFLRNGVLSYILLTDEQQNNCTTLPNCLPFNQSTYANFTITFGAQNSTRTSISSNLSAPKCSGYSFTRANGRNWCYDFGSNWVKNFDGAQKYCAAQNKFLNGFESLEEQQAFFAVAQKSFGLSLMIRLGARRISSCSGRTACLGVPMTWLSTTISTNTSLANTPKGMYFDGDGDTLVYRWAFGQWGYDDLINTWSTSFSCGWYAN